MTSAMKAGASYFGLVFAAGVLLGAMRVWVLVPRVGELAGVALELPLMLGISWLACSSLIELFGVPARDAARLAVGAVAFGLLMAAELAMSAFVLGRAPKAHLAAYVDPAEALGLLGQLAFAAVPLVQYRLRGIRST